MSRSLAALILLGISLVGIARLRWRASQLNDRTQRLNDFRRELVAYLGSQGKDHQAYASLTAKVERMQREAGSTAIASLYRPPFQNVAHRDYELLVNILPTLHSTITNVRWGLDEDRIRHYVDILDGVLNRYAGRLQEWGEQFGRDASNPLIWFREGIRALLLAPAFVLRSLGLWPESRSAALVHSGVFRVASAIMAFVVLAAGLVQIVTGWDATLAKLRDWGLSIPTAPAPPEQRWF